MSIPRDNIRVGIEFTKNLKKYRPQKQKLDDIVDKLRQNPKAGEEFKAKTHKGVRHFKYDKNFSVYYVHCQEARIIRNNKQCPWCKEDCNTIDENSLFLLNFDKHKITDRIR